MNYSSLNSAGNKKWRNLNCTISTHQKVPTFMSLTPNSPARFRFISCSLPDTFTWLSSGISKLIYLNYDFLPFLFFLFSVTASIFSKSNKNPGVTSDSSLSLQTLIYNPSMSSMYSTSKTCPSTSLQVHSHLPDPPLGCCRPTDSFMRIWEKVPFLQTFTARTRMFVNKKSIGWISTSTWPPGWCPVQ